MLQKSCFVNIWGIQCKFLFYSCEKQFNSVNGRELNILTFCKAKIVDYFCIVKFENAQILRVITKLRIINILQ